MVPRFSQFTQARDAIRYFDDNGFCIFKKTAQLEYLEDIRENISSLISDVLLRNSLVCVEPQNIGFDAGLIYLSRYSDELRKNLYNVLKFIPSVQRFGLTWLDSPVMNELGFVNPMHTSCSLRMDLPGDSRFLIPPHQDLHQTLSYKHIFFITAISDITADMGALRVYPGSHKHGFMEHVQPQWSRYQFIPDNHLQDFTSIQLPCEKGETILLTVNLVHASSPNTSDLVRWSHMSHFEDAIQMPLLHGSNELQIYNDNGLSSNEFKAQL